MFQVGLFINSSFLDDTDSLNVIVDCSMARQLHLL